jgi:ABC-type glycerol-3-phosphate transport system permease component
MKPLRLARRSLVHAILLAGCVVFAFPFLWLLSTSSKQSDELAVYPPQWVPRVPTYSEQSPFVDRAAYDDLARPDQLDESAWDRLRPALEEAVWTRAREVLPPERLADIEAMADHEQFRTQIVRGLWMQLKETVPDRIWKEAADGSAGAQAPETSPLVTFARDSVTPDLARRTAGNIVRYVGIGALLVRDARNAAIPMEAPSGWQVQGGETLTPDQIEAQPCQRLNYDMRQADGFPIVQTFRLPVPLRTDPAATGAAPDATARIQALDVPFHCDYSWHRANITLETGGKVYRGVRPFWFDIRSWEVLELIFKQPAYRNSRAIVLEADPSAATDVADPRAFRLTLAVEKSSRLRTWWDKYIYSYRWALQYIAFDEQLRTTVILVVLNVLGQLFACSLVAYAFARLNFYGRGFLFGLLLATMMLPSQVTMIPQFMLWKSLGCYNTLRPLWVPAWFGSAFFIFLLRQFFMTIPKELEDAAKIDGCGFFGIYWRIMLPLAGPAMATVAIFSFMASWNEFVQPLVYLSDERLYPLSLGLSQFRQDNAAEWGMLMAASTLMMLPVIAVFFFCQRYFIQGVTLTGLKG